MKTTLATLLLACLLTALVHGQQGNTVVSYSGSLNAASSSCNASNCMALIISGALTTAGIQVTGTWVATHQFEGSFDGGVTWNSVSAVPLTGGTLVTSITGNGNWLINVSGLTNVRIRSSAYTSGTAAVVMTLSSGSIADSVTISGALPTGANIIGKVGIDQTTPGTTNAVQATNFPATVDTNSGAPGASTLRTVPATSTPADATSNTSVPGFQMFPYVFNGTTWDRQKGITGQVGLPVAGVVNSGTNITDGMSTGVFWTYLNNAGSSQTFAHGIMGFNGTTMDRIRTAASLDTGLTTGLLASHSTLVDNNGGTFASLNAQALLRDRVVSAANTQTQKVYELRNDSQSLSIHAACSAGTAALTVEVSVDNSNWITVDSLTAAQFQAKVYGAATAGASAAAASAGPLAPVSFRWVRITEATCGASNTSTLTVAAK